MNLNHLKTGVQDPCLGDGYVQEMVMSGGGYVQEGTGIQTWDLGGWWIPTLPWPWDLGYQGIWLANGQYVPYWNAFLFFLLVD